MYHHAFIYKLNLQNPSKTATGYVYNLLDQSSRILSNTTIHHWFMTIAPFKGTKRVTSHCPGSCKNLTTISQLQRYLGFVIVVDHSSKFVFPDQKPIKEIDIYGIVRRHPYNGITPSQVVKSNSKDSLQHTC